MTTQVQTVQITEDEYQRLMRAAVRETQLELALRRIGSIEQGFMDSRQFHEFLQRQALDSLEMGKVNESKSFDPEELPEAYRPG